MLSLSVGACNGEGEGAADDPESLRTDANENSKTLDLTLTDEALFAAAMAAGAANVEYAAALRASKCLVDAAPEFDQIWSMTTFDRLYKIAPTEGLARRFKNLFDIAMVNPVMRVPERMDSAKLLEAAELRLILFELWRRKMTGAAWKAQASALESLLGEHEDDFWAPILPTQQLVFFHLFQRVDIATRRTKEDVTRELRERWESGNRKRLVRDIGFMYPVTHVIYVDTGYGDRFLDPADYPIEIDILDETLAQYAVRFPSNPMYVHLAFEVLASRRFLQQPETDEARSVKAALLRLQGENGCWRPGAGTDTIHATREAVHALGQFPTELRRLEPLPPSTR
jgi:hypothetical protein